MSLLNAQRRDGNEREIINALRKAGCYVRQMDKSAGFDLLVINIDGTVLLVEVKQSGEKLTQRENSFAKMMYLIKAPYHILETIDQAMQIIGRNLYQK